MPYNGSGTFQRTQNWAADAAAGIKIITTHHDSEDDNFAAGLSQVITRDGQSPPTANLPMGGFKHTNAANPVNPQDYATKSYADGIRNFSTGILLTGVSTGVAPNQVSTAYEGFQEANLSWVGRAAGSPAGTPARLALCNNFNGTGTDLAWMDRSGNCAGFIRMTERLIVASETYTPSVDVKYAEVEGLGPGGNGGSAASTGGATVAVGGAGGAGAHGWKVFTKAELGASVVITIAAAGSAGSTTFNPAGTAGVATVTGGNNGATGSAGATSATGGAAGGTASGWTINGVGMNGRASFAGFLSNPASRLTGMGGSSPYGGGGLETFSTATSAGGAATGYGAGGSPGGAGFSGSSMGGGAGTGSFLRLREYF